MTITKVLKIFLFFNTVLLLACTNEKIEDNKHVILTGKSALEINNKNSNDTVREVSPFVVSSIEDGLFHVLLADLVLKNGSGPKVKKLAKRLMFQYQDYNNRLSTIAKEKNIAIPNILSEHDQSRYDKLLKTDRNQIDLAYLKTVVSKLKKTLPELKQVLQECKDEKIKSLAIEQLPIIEIHMQKAEASLMIKIEGGK